jgi:lipid-binding SYLF domain-containing protein
MRFQAIVAAGVLALAVAAPAKVYASDQGAVLEGAMTTVDNLKHDPSFAMAQKMLRQARAVLIVPSLVKGGFMIGGEGGDGVLMARHGKHWSEPAFYTMGSASFGLQIGLEKAQLVLLIMSDKALHGIEQSNFKIGAGGGLTVVTLSAAAEGATSGNMSGDIVVWSSASGIYGGLTINGSVIKPRSGWNRDFYGAPVSVRDILNNKVNNKDTLMLRRALSSAL